MWDKFFRPSGAGEDSTRFRDPRLAPWATRFRPLRGLRGGVFYSISSPTAHAMGYRLSPASRAARRSILLDFLSHGSRHGLPAFARFAGCAVRVRCEFASRAAG